MRKVKNEKIRKRKVFSDAMNDILIFNENALRF